MDHIDVASGLKFVPSLLWSIKMGHMQFDVIAKARSIHTYIVVALATAAMIWLCREWTPVFGLLATPFIAWELCCIAADKKWRTYIDGERVVYDPLIFGTRRTLLIPEISRIDVRRDEYGISHSLVVVLKSGKRRRFDLGTEFNRREFIAAIACKNLDLEIRDPYWFNGIHK